MQTQPKWMTIAGWVLTVFIVGMLAFSATMKFRSPPDLVDELVGRLGYPAAATLYIGAAELASALLFLFPRTAVLGAVLLTGYLGGAVATHVRVEDNFAGPAIGGALVWLALFLREPRVRAMLPVLWRD
ncbi:MAG: DoxX family protein [Pirellulales bacterium]